MSMVLKAMVVIIALIAFLRIKSFCFIINDEKLDMDLHFDDTFLLVRTHFGSVFNLTLMQNISIFYCLSLESDQTSLHEIRTEFYHQEVSYDNFSLHK